MHAPGAVKNWPLVQFVGGTIKEFSFLSNDDFCESTKEALTACAVAAVDEILNLCKLLWLFTALLLKLLRVGPITADCWSGEVSGDMGDGLLASSTVINGCWARAAPVSEQIS